MTSIPTVHHWQPALKREGVVTGLNDINQAINIILMTPKGADPHRPTFGSDLWKYLDYPVNQAVPHIVRESVEAIREWEPRVDVVRVIPVFDVEHVTIRVQWKIADGAIQETEVMPK